MNSLLIQETRKWRKMRSWEMPKARMRNNWAKRTARERTPPSNANRLWTAEEEEEEARRSGEEGMHVAARDSSSTRMEEVEEEEERRWSTMIDRKHE